MWTPEDSAAGFETAVGVLAPSTSSSARPRPRGHLPVSENLTNTAAVLQAEQETEQLQQHNNDSNNNIDTPVPKLIPPPTVSRNPVYGFIANSNMYNDSHTAPTMPTSTNDDTVESQPSTTANSHYPEPLTIAIEPSQSFATSREYHHTNRIGNGVITNAVGWPGYLAATPVPSRRMVRQKDLPIYLALSILATVLFFPSGAIALYYAVKLRRIYKEGIYANNLEEATKVAKHCEKFLLITLVLAFVFGFLIFGLVDYYTTKGSYYTNTNTTKKPTKSSYIGFG